MKVKKFITLINNERCNTKFVSEKACTQDISNNHCEYEDHAICAVNSYDICMKDHAACYNHGYDYCNTFRDTDACIGSYDYN